jgi:hypothetical protein
MNEDNPAVSKQVSIPPAFLEEVGGDPRALEAWCRKLYLVGVDKMQRAMRDQTIPLSQRLSWLDHLAKYGGLGQARNQPITAQGSGFSVQIVLNNQTPSPTPTTTQPLPTVEIIENEPAEAASTTSADTDE